MGQAVWLTGFSQSFANQSIFSIYALNMGAPEPAAISFGLAGAWPISLFIRMGMHPADAYSMVVACWLTVAFAGAFLLARRRGTGSVSGAILAVGWLCLPVVVGHARYSMLSVGIALLPAYLLCAEHTFEACSAQGRSWLYAALQLALACLVAVFMDGYTFMMFACGAGIFAIGYFFSIDRTHRLSFGLKSGISLAVCFGGSYGLYASYSGQFSFPPSSVNFFRGWGVDIAFLLAPTKGVHWLPDLLGLSVHRTSVEQFGDASVWQTTFLLPLLLSAAITSVMTWQHKSLTRTLAPFLILLFGFYLSLGPSLKYYSTKPPGVTERGMAAEHAIMATGTELLSTKVPGFNNMRASYRWTALGALGAWLLLLGAIGAARGWQQRVGWALSGIIVVTAIPNLSTLWSTHRSYRSQFLLMEAEAVEPLKILIPPDSKVVFLPWRNDMLINYAASRLGFVAFNIGGDKNFQSARQHWPPVLKQFLHGQANENFVRDVSATLEQGVAEIVVIPHIDTLWAAHQWPFATRYDELAEKSAKAFQGMGGFKVQTTDHFTLVALDHELETLCPREQCLSSRHERTRVFSQVGARTGDLFQTNDRRGFLFYGPYTALEAGRHCLRIKGSMANSTGARLDVVSSKGTVTHAVFAEKEVTIDPVGYFDVHLEHSVEDIEVRMFVKAETQLSVGEYMLAEGGCPPSRIN